MYKKHSLRNWIEEWLGTIVFTILVLLGAYLGFWKILLEPVIALAEASAHGLGVFLQGVIRTIVACVVYYVFYISALVANDRIDDVMIDRQLDREWEEKCNAEEDEENNESA